MNFYTRNINYLLGKKPGVNLSGLSVNFEEQPSVEDLITLSNYFGFSVDTLLRKDLEKSDSIDFSRMRFLVLDVDGVMTDGGMYYTESGDEFKKFNTKDGMAIKGITKKGIPVGIISSGINENLIKRRAALLGIEYVYVGKKAKLPILEEWCKQLNISLNDVLYVGDDINDHAVMDAVGMSACPSDAIDSIKAKVSLVLSRKGGHACIRELLDEYLP